MNDEFALKLKPESRSIDWPTLSIILLMIGGFLLSGYLMATGYIHWLLAILLGTLFMNLSFTAWHESSHSNFSKYKFLNHTFGWIASFASVYPGYFARRRKHLAHHKWEGQPGKDPVYLRIQIDKWWKFPWQLIKVNFIDKIQVDIPDSFCTYTNKHKFWDLISNLSALLLVIYLSFLGYFTEVLCVWVIPRGLILFIHAFYICFFPHNIHTGGYQLYRVRGEKNWLMRFLTMEQNYHGIHHRFPFIPWYRYSKLAQTKHKELEQEKIEFI